MKWTRALVRAGILMSVGLAGVLGCSIITSYDGFYGLEPACGKQLPTRPAEGTGGAGGELVGAMTALRFLSTDDAAPYGYNLDTLCTCPDKVACTNTSATNSQCDLANGIDNAAGQALNSLFPVSADDRTAASLAAGNFGLVARVIGWDGTADDDSVQVSLYNVASITNGAFNVDDGSLLNPQDLGSKYVDTSAYVSGGVLVASFDFDFRLDVPTTADAASNTIVTIPLTSAYLVGKIAREETSGLRMAGAQLIGRIPVSRIFTELSSLGLCTNQASFDSIKMSVCATLDLPTDPTQDGKTGNCDALSFAMGIDLGPATLGTHMPAATAPNPCGDEPAASCN